MSETPAEPFGARLRRIIEAPPWTRPPQDPGLAVDDETRRLLGNMTAVSVQVLLLLAFVSAAAVGRSPGEALLLAISVCGLALFRLRRRPFQGMPPPSPDRAGDYDYWRSTRGLFRGAQFGALGLGLLLVALIDRHAGRDAADLAARLLLQLALAAFGAFAYAVQ